jgi:hypothetical protein
MEFKAPIYISDNSFKWHLTSNFLIIISFAILITTSIIAAIIEPSSIWIWQITCLLCFIGIFKGAKENYNLKEPLNGKLVNSLTIKLTGISTPEHEYLWNDIHDFKFAAHDYEDKELFSGVSVQARFIGPSYSLGTSNFISFIWYGERVMIKFQLTKLEQARQLANVLEPAYINNRISSLRF